MPDPNRHLEDYIGDGAYVYMESWGDVVLYTSDGIRETARVCLEPEVLQAFKRWLERRDEYIARFAARRSEGKCLKDLECLGVADHDGPCEP